MNHVSIIQSVENLNNIKIFEDSVLILNIVMSNDHDYIRNTKGGLILLSVDDNFYEIGIGHPDLPTVDMFVALDFIFKKTCNMKKRFLFNVKKLANLDDRFLEFNCIDTFEHIKMGEITERDTTFTHKYFQSKIKTKIINYLIPACKHMESFIHNVKELTIPSTTELIEPGYNSVMKDIIPQLFWIEKNGMCVDPIKLKHFFGDKFTDELKNNLVYSNYNVWSATGRPSNTFGGINFAALEKLTGERSTFISRYGNNGILALFDFKAYHPRLLAKLANFEIPSDVGDIYVWLCKQMYKKEVLTEEEFKAGKGSVFQQLYGKIEDKNLSIPYFRAIQNYIDQRWKYFRNNGYVDTPIYKRGITENHIKGAFANKVTNYILQAYETERNCEVMKVLYSLLLNKKTIPILYSYDSILFDVHKSDGMKIIEQIKSTMESGGFPVTVVVGKDFQNMVSFYQEKRAN